MEFEVYDWLKNLLIGLAAPQCVLCRAPAHNALEICPPCRRELPWLSDGCPVCALPGTGSRICGRCRQRPPPFDSTTAAFRYEGDVARLIRAFKFHHDLPAGRLLADLLGTRLAGLRGAGAALVPMPLHRSRLRHRGFNQSVEIARRLPGRIAHGVATRRRATTPQTELRGKARQANLRGAFAIRSERTPARVVIVDDVVTTGASVSELSRSLRRGGAERVDVVALARAGRDRVP